METEHNLAVILERLVRLPSVVGRPNDAIVGWIRDYAESCGANVTLVPGPERDRASLLATVGPTDCSRMILSGHMDVVPAEASGWTHDAFALSRDGDRHYGRGTSDMKGFLACTLAARPSLAKEPPARPIHLAFSYDEEAGCRGVPRLIAALPRVCASPEGCVVGDPIHPTNSKKRSHVPPRQHRYRSNRGADEVGS